MPGGGYQLFLEAESGWTTERLMAHYVLTEAQYEKILVCPKAYWMRGVRSGTNDEINVMSSLFFRELLQLP